MRRVRFAPSPTGSLHVGNALTAAANRTFGDRLLLRIDDTDPTRTVEHGEREVLRDVADGGRRHLRALRLALTERERGPEPWTAIHALPPDEALRRVDAAL
jgi:hypothetical protein